MRLGDAVYAVRGMVLWAAAFGAVALSTAEPARAQDAEGDKSAEADKADKAPAPAKKPEMTDAERAAAEEKNPRPPLPPAPDTQPPPWGRTLEIGGDVALVARPASTRSTGDATGIRYRTAVGYGVHARWDIFRYLRFTSYFIDAQHTVLIPDGALGVSAPVTLDTADSFSFGARLSPTLPLTERARVWLTSGVGWGRIELGRMTVQEPGTEAFVVRERSMSFVEIPLGVGVAFEIIPRWLAVEVEVTGAFVLGQEGSALHDAQGIDATGKKRLIGSFPEIDASFVQTLGLSLLL